MIPSAQPPRLLLTVRGAVQGVGFRPFVYRLAVECGLSGGVRNCAAGVEIDVQGVRVREFVGRLQRELPVHARIESLDIAEMPRVERAGFAIGPTDASGDAGALIPADLAVCDDCLREMLDPADRRYGYPFINCTNCGPRYTITRSLPYDRARTSMAVFAMCPECAAEYHDPGNRRFHAQPNACPVCGPSLRYECDGRSTDSADAVAAALALLRAGGVLALRGLGGYHLAVDARNDDAVRLLRRRKHREQKPLAVMVRDLATARGLCRVDAREQALLESAARPIVLLETRKASPSTTGLAPGIAPDTRETGIMLPYTPLHHLLLRGDCDALVMTSGNMSDEPICIGCDEAAQRLSGIADGFLHHDRGILQRCDDSVTRVIDGAPRPLRRSRGHVPVPVMLDSDGPCVLAVGADLKNTCCVAAGRRALLSQHIGDLEHYAASEFLDNAARHLLTMARAVPQFVAHDLHPGYVSTLLAHRLADEFGLGRAQRVAVQHHHAHFAACLAESGFRGPAIGVILDGTGYGVDGTIWGGEFLAGDARAVRRVGAFRRVAMPGGELAVREPWRMAAAHLDDTFGEGAPAMIDAVFPHIDPERRAAVMFALRTGTNAPLTSSCGRLFDAVSALAGLCDTAGFEAQAAMRLERAAAAAPRDARPYGFACDAGADGAGDDAPAFRLDFRPMIAEILDDVRNGARADAVAGRFHRTLIDACGEGAMRARTLTGLTTVVLSGGVFQNALMLAGLGARLRSDGFTVLTQSLAPCNDGGIALGQALVARASSDAVCLARIAP